MIRNRSVDGISVSIERPDDFGKLREIPAHGIGASMCAAAVNGRRDQHRPRARVLGARNVVVFAVADVNDLVGAAPRQLRGPQEQLPSGGWGAPPLGGEQKPKT